MRGGTARLLQRRQVLKARGLLMLRLVLRHRSSRNDAIPTPIAIAARRRMRSPLCPSAHRRLPPAQRRRAQHRHRRRPTATTPTHTQHAPLSAGVRIVHRILVSVESLVVDVAAEGVGRLLVVPEGVLVLGRGGGGARTGQAEGGRGTPSAEADATATTTATATATADTCSADAKSLQSGLVVQPHAAAGTGGLPPLLLESQHALHDLFLCQIKLICLQPKSSSGLVLGYRFQRETVLQSVSICPTFSCNAKKTNDDAPINGNFK
mmetsp:Transcript_3583/g.10179  ORF Transcript_3583/g.10179 Transcript_3583/m.10179 type:complete len:265 (-) Transcript_3583:162-956(-)